MSWSQQVFRYCERGQDGAFWAEPLNALTNAAFLLAAVLAAMSLARSRRRDAAAEWVLVGLVAVIGIGSFLFHTFATRWAAIADVAPIGLFMLAYFAYALRVFLRLHWLMAGLGLAAFVAALQTAGDVTCANSVLPVTAAGRHPCFNGTLGYAPALAAMLGVGALLAARGHAAARLLLAAGCVFAASMVFRTLDFEVCALTNLFGRPRGTHALWHLLNAGTLFLLLRAAIRHGGAGNPPPAIASGR